MAWGQEKKFHVYIASKEIGFDNPALSFIRQEMTVAKGAREKRVVCNCKHALTWYSCEVAYRAKLKGSSCATLASVTSRAQCFTWPVSIKQLCSISCHWLGVPRFGLKGAFMARPDAASGADAACAISILVRHTRRADREPYHLPLVIRLIPLLQGMAGQMLRLLNNRLLHKAWKWMRSWRHAVEQYHYKKSTCMCFDDSCHGPSTRRCWAKSRSHGNDVGQVHPDHACMAMSCWGVVPRGGLETPGCREV